MGSNVYLIVPSKENLKLVVNDIYDEALEYGICLSNLEKPYSKIVALESNYKLEEDANYLINNGIDSYLFFNYNDLTYSCLITRPVLEKEKIFLDRFKLYKKVKK